MRNGHVGQRTRLVELKNCPVCKMDSGFRVKKTNKETGNCSYVVRCLTCGAETKTYNDQYNPAKQWNRGNVYRKGEIR